MSLDRRSAWRHVGALVAAVLACGSMLPASTIAADPLSATVQISWTRPGVAGTLQPPAALRVGDEVTIAFELEGFSAAGCGVRLEHAGTGSSMGAGQSELSVDGEGYCRPWTFILPPAPAGQVGLYGEVHGQDSDDRDVAIQPELAVQLEAGGSPRTFASDYPAQSWALVDVVGSATVSAGAPFTVARPTGATRDCSYLLNGDMATFISARLIDYESCENWEVTLPDLRAQVLSDSPFGLPWSGDLHVSGGSIDPDTGAFLHGGATIANLSIDGDGTDEFSSNLPAMVFPEPMHPRYVLTGTTITIDPDVEGLAGDGTCRMGYTGPITPEDGTEVVVPMTDGACEPISFVASQPGIYQVGGQLHVGDGVGPFSGYRVDVLDPMPAPSLTVETPVVGLPFDVTSSVGSGMPSAYDIGLEPTGATQAAVMALADGFSTCASGALDFLADERSVDETCTPTSAGTHRVTISYEDVTGATRTRSRTVTVLAFRDIVGHKFALDITWLAVEGITSGCTATTYCPDRLVTRAQMATFLTRALNLPPTTRDYFTDDGGSVHQANINRLRAAGITAGCSATRFCPNGLVTRAQMATFLARAYHLPSTSTDYFTDDERATHEPRINALRASGITSGCGGTRFCPDGLVTRGQMAAFLHRASD